MQMQPQGAGQPAMSPDHVVQALTPITNAAMRIFDTGVTLPSTLNEAILAGFLVGRGMSPATAMDTVLQWRTTGAARSLARTMRAEPAAERPQVTAPMSQAPTAMFPPAPAPAGRQERESLARKIEAFMQDQATAAAFYGQMAEQATDAAIRDYIEHARDDEQKHYRLLGALYKDLTGRTYTASPQPVSYATLAEGLKMALDDELEAAEEYRETYLQNRNDRVRDVFFELMTDEMEHATRFTYALHALAHSAHSHHTETEEEGEAG